ncbi:MAG: helix-turn-helix transcriptional regulator [Clostridium sp.]|nr:helix-turn-helix transcriptional regulator [Clostridium sp.]
MRVSDLIALEIERQGMSQQMAAALCGMTRQRLWDILDKRNPHFRTVERIMAGLGYAIVLEKKTDFFDPKDQAAFLETCRTENPMFDSLVRILDAVGYELLFVKTSGDGAGKTLTAILQDTGKL